MFHVYDVNGHNRHRVLEDLAIEQPPKHMHGATANIHDTPFRLSAHDKSRYVAKLYKQEHPYYQNYLTELEDTLTYMVRNKYTYLQHPFAWPEFLLYEEQDAGERLCGFLMKYAPDFTLMEQYINNRDDERNRWLIAYKFSRSLAELHEKKICIGDLHPGNILIRPRPESNLFDCHFIDCDSYTIIHTDNTIRHRSQLMPRGEYMLKVLPASGADVLINDRHAAAHILFELFVGYSPYESPRIASRYLLDTRTFPCISIKHPAHHIIQTQFDTLSQSIKDLFIRAFSTDDIPTVAEFHRAIYDELTNELANRP